MSKQSGVSLCMIVRNEEAHLAACLESVKELVDEIIVVDTGSTDRTKEVAVGCGAKVVDFAWVDDFAAARNECLRHARGRYILWLDGDEHFDADNRERLRCLVGELQGERVAYFMKQRSLLEGPLLPVQLVDQVRLFPNLPELRWEHRAHEQILSSLIRAGIPARHSEVVIEHLGYGDRIRRVEKCERNLRLLLLDQADNPNDPFTLCNIGSAYTVLNEPARALPFLQRSLDLSQPKNLFRRKAYILLAQCQRQIEQKEQAQATCQVGRQEFPDDAQLLFAEGFLLREHGRREEAEQCFLQLVNNPSKFCYEDPGVVGFKARHGLALIYSDQGRHAEAESLWRTILQERSDFAPARQALDELSTRAVNRRPRRPLAKGVSLCMIVRNEEKNLPECLQSAAGLFDEIIVVDTGSSDRTKEVAAGFGARVVDFEWVDSFAAARNETLRHATREWIFWMDADDRLTESNRTRLKELLASPHHEETLAYTMKCLCLPEPASGPATVVDHIRLFRNRPQLWWKFRVHEQILPSLHALGGRIVPADVLIHHVGYQDAKLNAKKLDRDLHLLEMDYKEHPDHPYVLFNLGWNYSERNQLEQALALLRKSLELASPLDTFVRKLYSIIVHCYRRLGRVTEALKYCQVGQRLFADDAELLSQEAMIHWEQGDLATAEAVLFRLLESKTDPLFASRVVGINSSMARHNLALLYYEQGRIKEAEAQWQAAVKEGPDYVPAHVGLAEMYLAQQRFDQFEQALARLDALPLGAIFVPMLRARGHVNRKEFVRAAEIVEQAIIRRPREVMFWQTLSYIRLLEGRDWAAAEQALRRLLELDPANAEARFNLAVLLKQLALAAKAGNGSIPDLRPLFHFGRQNPAHIHQHCPTLFALASECRHVTQVGMRNGAVAAAFLLAEPDRIVCYDFNKYPYLGVLRALAGGTELVVQPSDTKVDLEETDLLFLESIDDLNQLQEELASHAAKVKKYLVCHLPFALAGQPESQGQSSAKPAVAELLAQGMFKLKPPEENRKGMLVLQRI